MAGAGLLTIIIIAIFILGNAVRILREYERGVIFRLGRLMGARGPGLIFLIPIVDRMVRVSLRVVTMDVPAQDVITRDNVSVKVNAVVYFRVIDVNKAIVEVVDFLYATSMIAQTTLRSVLGQVELDDLLTNREKINQQLQHIIDEQTEPWGIKVSVVEVKNVDLPENMQRAIARQAEAERERRAVIIQAEGEVIAAQNIANAAKILAEAPGALHLRTLHAINDISSDQSNTVVFTVPLEILRAFSGQKDSQTK